MIVRVESQKCRRLQRVRVRKPYTLMAGVVTHTSGTAGTENVGIPFANVPKPACDPHMASEASSSSPMISLALRNSAAGPVVENLFTKVFMMMVGRRDAMGPHKLTRPRNGRGRVASTWLGAHL